MAGYLQMKEPSRNKNQSHSRRREEAPTEQVQSKTDQNINASSVNHGIMQEINALNKPSVNVTSVMDGNLTPSILDSSLMHLDMIMVHG